MANYIITTEVITGTPTVVAAEVETYLQSIDDTTQTLLDIGWLGNAEYVTAIIIHEDTA